jgi:uncharacterized membrane protein
MYARAAVAVQQRLGLAHLATVCAAFALVSLVRLREGVLAEQEQLPKRVDREVALRVLLLVDDRR